MKNLKDLSIVNYKSFKGHDGMRGINAEIKYKGKKIASVYDDARGGEWDYDVLGYGTPKYDTNKQLFQELLNDVSGLDKVECYGTSLDPSLDYLIEELCNQKDMDKDVKKGILIKANHGYDIVQWKIQLPTLIKKYKNGLSVIQKAYDEHKDNDIVLNKDYLKSIGVNV